MDSFTQFDGNLLIGIQNALNADWLTPVMKVITFFGEGGYFWIAVCLLLMIFKRTRRLGIICSLSLAFTFICCNLVLKPTFDRTRPWLVFEAVNRMLPDPGDASFPSGHSANAMGPAWGMFMASLPVKLKSSGGGALKSYDAVPCLGWNGAGADPRTVHKYAIAAVILALLIGISRIYLGMHYPSDVICGLLTGMICATAVYTVMTAIENKHGRVIGGIRQDV